jgi:prepilin-type N-terminal cleavage/methylation domain-containing protein/prepilin-type processing-associated H-X9-DG protein
VRKRFHSIHGFTLIEMLVVVAIIAMVATLLLGAMAKAKSTARSIQCVSQLHQIGIHAVAEATENGLISMRLRPNRARGPVATDASMRKVYLCPADAERIGSLNATNLNATNTSYFASSSASADHPRSILGGDRNITVYSAAAHAQVRTTGNVRLARTNTFGWWRDLHKFRGNVLLADGSAHNTKPEKLNAVIAEQLEFFFWQIPNGATVTTPAH